MPDPRQQEVLKQINEAWEHAKAQLKQLRDAVEKTGALAQAKIDSTFVGRERDRALRDLGEAVWAQVKVARLSLPAAVAPALKAMHEVEKKAEAQNKEINALISEGGEAFDRIKARSNKSHKTAAMPPKGKKK